jgi:hypothetical protein
LAAYSARSARATSPAASSWSSQAATPSEQVTSVVGLEGVEVEQGHAQGLAEAGRPGQLPGQLVVPGPPVGHPGEGVGAGQLPDLPVQGPDLGQQPQQGADQDADREPGAEHQRRRDRALGQDRIPGQGA